MKQNTPEWLEMRKNYIGASDAPIIMGTCKFKLNDGRLKTPYLLWQEKLGLAKLESNNFATEFGKQNENIALRVYEDMVKDHFVPTVVYHKDIKYMMASLDGLNVTQDYAVEIKCANKDDHSLASEGKVPAHYYPQVQHQLAVLNINELDYFSFHKGEGVIVKVKKDESYLAELYEKEEKFWKCVEDLVEPALTNGDYVQRGRHWEECALKLWEIKQQKKAIEREEKELENQLKEFSEGLNSSSGSFRFGYHMRKGTVDYKNIPELKNVDLESYRKKPTQSWRLTQCD